MAGQIGNSDGDVGFQIAPMVDVVFVLVLFFMASAGMQQMEKHLSVKLPSIQDPSKRVSYPIFVAIDERGQVSIEGQVFDTASSEDLPALTAQLKEMMAENDGKDPVVICPQKETRHKRVVSVINAASKAGVKVLTFS